MDSPQARFLIRETFTQSFDKGRFQNFIRNLLNHIDESKAAPMAVPDAFAAHVRSCRRLGTYESPDGELADVLIVNTTAPWKLERTRTALRDFVAHKLKRSDSYKEAGLIAFVSPDARSWRFSFVRMEYQSKRDEKTGKIAVEETVTPARRFSYIVGEGENCHTAQTRFVELLLRTNVDPTLGDIEKAFSVEAVTKEFFKLYADLFNQLNASLEKIVKRDKAIAAEFINKRISTVNFAKKLLGQIVFLYFLQKKGWLGAEKGKDWGTGPRDFLRRLADRKYGAYDNFFNDVLEHLFYDTLASDRGHEAWCKTFNCRIPFLNGGLFEPLGDYNWRKTDIILPNKLFTNTDRMDKTGDIGTGILDVFDRYNFTVNEAEPLEKEVAIDPEMLGKVFENLIEENRRKGLGSYYTPREIVHYMCQESLINYLDTAVNTTDELMLKIKLKQEKLLGSPEPEQAAFRTAGREERVPRADLETFIRLGDQISHYESVETEYRIKMPKSIKQNARLIDAKLADITICDPAVGSGAFPVGMMAEIVRARTALTNEFNDVHDRTSYHFKRHAIQNCLYGVDIDPSAVEIAKLRLWLSLVVDEEDVKQIKPLPNLFYKIVAGNSLVGVEKDLFNEQLFRRLEELKPLYFDEVDRNEKDRYKQQIEDIIHALTNGKEAFDFEIYFSEVFHRKGGFDVVIANPPYITYHGRRRTLISATQLNYLRNHYACVFEKKKDGKYNSAMFFIEKFLQIGNSGSTSCCITDISFYEHFYQGLKKYLLESTRLLRVINGLSSFENVASGQLIIIAAKCRDKTSALSAIVRVHNSGIHSEPTLVEQREWYRPENKYQFFTPEKKLDALFRKFEDQHNPLNFYFPNKLIRTGESIGVKENGFIVEKPVSSTKIPIYEYLEGGKSVAARYATPVPTRYFRFDIELLNRRNEAYQEDARRHKRKNPKVLGIGDKLAFDNPKVLIRQSCDHLCCTYTPKPYVYNRSYYSISSVNSSGSSAVNLLYVLALLNSTLFTFYARKKRVIRMEHGKQPQIRLEDIKTLRIKMPNEEGQTPFVEHAKKILAAKARDASADTSALEREIDQLVYVLYDLTPEEIQIVEGAAK